MSIGKYSLLTVALLGIGTIVTPSSSHGIDRRVIEVDSRATSINDFVDVGVPGPTPGDIYVFVDDLFVPGGTRQVGQAVGRCNLIDPTIGSFECTTIISFGDSTITTNEILYNVPGVVSVGSITG